MWVESDDTSGPLNYAHDASSAGRWQPPSGDLCPWWSRGARRSTSDVTVDQREVARTCLIVGNAPDEGLWRRWSNLPTARRWSFVATSTVT